MSHCGPENPSGQLQLPSMQVPPLLQVMFSQGSIGSGSWQPFDNRKKRRIVPSRVKGFIVVVFKGNLQFLFGIKGLNLSEDALDLSGLEKGVYFINIEIGEEVYAYRVMKM